jgi:hypothetical protein
MAAFAFCEAHSAAIASRGAECAGGEASYWVEYVVDSELRRRCELLAADVARGFVGFQARAADKCLQDIEGVACSVWNENLGPWISGRNPESIVSSTICGGVFVPRRKFGERCSYFSCLEGRCSSDDGCNATCKATTTVGTGEVCDYLQVCGAEDYCVRLCRRISVVGGACDPDNEIVCPEDSYCDGASRVCTQLGLGSVCDAAGVGRGGGDACSLFGELVCAASASGGHTCQPAPRWGEPCEPERGCAGGLLCGDIGNGSGAYRCTGRKLVGEMCQRSFECASNRCANGLCIGPQPVGGSCVIGGDCVSGRCSMRRCQEACE